MTNRRVRSDFDRTMSFLLNAQSTGQCPAQSVGWVGPQNLNCLAAMPSLPPAVLVNFVPTHHHPACTKKRKPRLLPPSGGRNDKIICTRTEIVLYSCPPHSHRDEPLRGDVAISVLGCAPILTPHLGEFRCYQQNKKRPGHIHPGLNFGIYPLTPQQ